MIVPQELKTHLAPGPYNLSEAVSEPKENGTKLTERTTLHSNVPDNHFFSSKQFRQWQKNRERLNREKQFIKKRYFKIYTDSTSGNLINLIVNNSNLSATSSTV